MLFKHNMLFYWGTENIKLGIKLYAFEFVKLFVPVD